MKSFLRKTLCIVLMLVLAASACVNAFAAGEDKYVSEVVIAYGDSGKAELEKAGYFVKDYNLNDGAALLAGGSQTSVWLGYKVTDNPDEAITDIAVMNMNGKYSFANYQAVIDTQIINVGRMVSRYRVAIDELAKNYIMKKTPAKLAYTLLNMFWEDDSQRGLGDFFTDVNIKNSDIETVFLEGNGEYLAYVQLAIAMGLAEPGENSLVSKIEEISIGDDYPASLAGMCKVLYGEMAAVKEQLKAFYEVRDHLPSEFTAEDLSAYLEKNAKSMGADKLRDAEIGYAVWNIAKDVDYAGSGATLLQLFEKDENLYDDRWLFPLAMALTDGQAVCVETSGLGMTLAASEMSEEEFVNLINTAETRIKELGGKTVSIYDGIDRDIFTPNGIALTEEASKASNNDSGKNWTENSDKKTSDSDLNGMDVIAIVGAIAGVFFIGIMSIWALGDMAFLGTSGVAAFFSSVFSLGFLGNFMIVWLLGFFFFCVGYLILRYVFGMFSDEEAAREGIIEKKYTHLEKPRIIVSKEEDPNGKDLFVYYYAVRDLDGEIADINGGSLNNPEWNVLYTTKNGYAGEPVKADFVLQDNDKAGSGYEPVHGFGARSGEGEALAYNLNNGLAKTDKAVYMFVQHEGADAGLEGSVFSSATVMLIALAAFVVGGGISGGVVGAIAKKKKAEIA